MYSTDVGLFFLQRVNGVDTYLHTLVIQEGSNGLTTVVAALIVITMAETLEAAVVTVSERILLSCLVFGVRAQLLEFHSHILFLLLRIYAAPISNKAGAF